MVPFEEDMEAIWEGLRRVGRSRARRPGEMCEARGRVWVWQEFGKNCAIGSDTPCTPQAGQEGAADSGAPHIPPGHKFLVP